MAGRSSIHGSGVAARVVTIAVSLAVACSLGPAPAGAEDPRPSARSTDDAVAGSADTVAGSADAVAHSADAGGAPFEILGTWYVLIHYQDPKTANPDAVRWKDLVWVFSRKGTRLEWTEYPIIVLDDETGRFENLGLNTQRRLLVAWEPTEAQQVSIRAGPRVNRRGMKVKTLKGSDARGWQSVERPAMRSTTAIGYQERVSVENLGALPRFAREDVLGNAMRTDFAGGTHYEALSIDRDGDELSGRYERDGRQTGTFRMWRTEPVRSLIDSESWKTGEGLIDTDALGLDPPSGSNE